jgi:hypothetical protein
MAKPLAQMPYQTVGDLMLTFPQANVVENYRRAILISKPRLHMFRTQWVALPIPAKCSPARRIR